MHRTVLVWPLRVFKEDSWFLIACCWKLTLKQNFETMRHWFLYVFYKINFSRLHGWRLQLCVRILPGAGSTLPSPKSQIETILCARHAGSSSCAQLMVMCAQILWPTAPVWIHCIVHSSRSRCPLVPDKELLFQPEESVWLFHNQCHCT